MTTNTNTTDTDLQALAADIVTHAEALELATYAALRFPTGFRTHPIENLRIVLELHAQGIWNVTSRTIVIAAAARIDEVLIP